MNSIRTLCFSIFVIPQIICILFQQQILMMKCYAMPSFFQPSILPFLSGKAMSIVPSLQQPIASDVSLTGNRTLLVTENITYFPELANQSATARKFDDTDLNLV